MSADPNKKSSRTFQCRDVLWETFEQMARELECSIDYLINESMKQYARQRSYGGTGSRTPFPAPGRGVEAQPQAGAAPQAAPLPPPGRPPGALPAPSRLPPPPGRSALPAPPGPPSRSALPAPPPPAAGRAASMPPPRGGPHAPGPRTMPPPLPRGPAAAAPNGFPAPAAHGATLTLMYNGERHAVTKDRYVIGRGKQSSDLTLKDPNVSRQHAMIEFQNGVYFMVDMGSTNGVEYNGQRIARKQIGEGDAFRICDHDLVFTYR
ncbi:MAG: FHA domain-containing protein [Polyangiaceae bacterium]